LGVILYEGCAKGVDEGFSFRFLCGFD